MRFYLFNIRKSHLKYKKYQNKFYIRVFKFWNEINQVKQNWNYHLNLFIWLYLNVKYIRFTAWNWKYLELPAASYNSPSLNKATNSTLCPFHKYQILGTNPRRPRAFFSPLSLLDNKNFQIISPLTLLSQPIWRRRRGFREEAGGERWRRTTRSSYSRLPKAWSQSWALTRWE